MSRILDVYLQENLVGRLEQNTNGELSFTYSANYLATAVYGISLSLPLQGAPFTGAKVKAFFSGLLPEESVRARLAGYLGLSANNPFALLEAVGGDCAGALALYEPGLKPSTSEGQVQVLDNAQLQELLNLIKRQPMLAGDNGYRLSLAGAQDKLAVGFDNGQVRLIKGSPTTHILKPIIEHIQDSAHNELFCMQLAKMIGLEVPEAALHFVNDTPYYLVSRYDRQIAPDGTVIRIHQEDFCQALGIASEIKYEREGGPNIATCQALITKYGARPALDNIKLLKIILFNFLIGNADAHGKNFSLLYKSSKPELAPAYDLLSTAIYPNLSNKMAMKIGGKYKPQEVYLHNFYKLVADTKLAQATMKRQIKSMTDKIIDAAASLKTKLVSDGLSSSVFEDILKIIEKNAKRLSE